MSLQTIQNQIQGVQREIGSLNQRLSDKARQEADLSGRIAQAHRSITSAPNIHSIQSKQREIQRYQDEVARLQREMADLQRQIADKTATLHRYQQEYYREQEREQKKFQESLERERKANQQRQQREALRHLMQPQRPNPSRISSAESDVTYDAFISHASEDKDEIVRPLAEALRSRGHHVWYDEFELRVGDSLRRSIDRGLANSTFGIVVLSEAFFAKNWPQYELDGMVAKEMNASDSKVILPLWHKVSKDEVMRYSPTLADKVALNTATQTIDEIASELSEALKNTKE